MSQVALLLFFFSFTLKISHSLYLHLFSLNLSCVSSCSSSFVLLPSLSHLNPISLVSTTIYSLPVLSHQTRIFSPRGTETRSLEEKMRENLLFSKWIFCCVFLVIFLKNFFLKDFRSIWLLVLFFEFIEWLGVSWSFFLVDFTFTGKWLSIAFSQCSFNFSSLYYTTILT